MLARVRGVSAVGVVAVLVLGLASGCVSAPGLKGTAEERVRARAQERWDALIAGDVEKAYSYFSPGARQARSLASYRAMIRVGFWKSAKVESVECPSPGVCRVAVQVEYTFRGADLFSPVKEEWVLSDQQWWMSGL